MTQILKIPSQALQEELRSCRSSFVNTAGRIQHCYELAIAEGFNKWEARQLIVAHVGLSDHQVRKYLPPEAKETKFDSSKRRKVDVTSGSNLEALYKAGELTKTDYVALGGDDERFTVVKSAHLAKIASCIERKQAFNIVVRAGKVIAVEPLITHKGDAGNDPALLKQYGCEV